MLAASVMVGAYLLYKTVAADPMSSTKAMSSETAAAEKDAGVLAARNLGAESIRAKDHKWVGK